MNEFVITINGVNVTSKVIFPIQLSFQIDGGQNGGGFVLYDDFNNDAYPQFSECTISENGTSSFWYLHDKVDQDNHGAQYKHTITLIDPLRILEGYYLADITFTQPLQRNLALAEEVYTYKTAIERVLDITPIHLSADSPKFTLNSTIATKLDGIEFPESFSTGKNIYEFLLNVGRALAAVPVMTTASEISFVFLDDITNEISSFTYHKYFAEKAIDQYCTNIDTTLENLIAENDDEQGAIVVPAESGGLAIKPKDAIRLDDDYKEAVLELPLRIHKLKAVYVRNITLSAMNSDGYNVTKTIDLDISKYILEKTVYETLTTVNKQKYMYYTYGDYYIEGIYYYYKILNLLPTNYAITEVINQAAADFWGAGYTISQKGNEIVSVIQFRVEYVPLPKNIRCKIERKHSSDFRTEFSFYSKQTDAAVSAKSTGNLYQQHIERIGKQALVLQSVFSNYIDVPQIGQSLNANGNRYYLYKYNALFDANVIEVESFWSKDYTAVSELIGLNALPRFSEISADTVNRSDVYREHCILSRTPGISNGSFYNHQGQTSTVNKKAVKLLVSGLDDDPCNMAYVSTKYLGEFVQSATIYLLLPVLSVALGNSLMFSISFKDNYSAGTKLVAAEGGDQARDVRYTGINSLGGSFGRVSEIGISFQTDVQTPMNLAAAKMLPEYDVSDTSVNLLWYLGMLKYSKDTREIPNINYMLNIETDNDNLILGEVFTQRNPLISKAIKTYVKYSTLTKQSYNSSTHTWYNDASGAFVVYNGSHYLDTAFRRHNGTFTESAGGNYLIYSGNYYEILPENRYNWDNLLMQFVQNNNGTHLWVPSGGIGSYVNISTATRYYLTGYTQNDTGEFFQLSKELRLVGLTSKLNINHKGKVLYSNPNLTIGVNPYYENGSTFVPVLWFGNTYGTTPTLTAGLTGWAIVDERDNLWLGCNDTSLAPIYYKFKKEKTYANQV